MPQSEAPQREVLMAPCPQRKISDDQWIAIRSLAEQGVEYKEIGSQFGCSGDTIRKRAWQCFPP
jgi:DNA invertase Pin-like site-specific DNA recombinase